MLNPRSLRSQQGMSIIEIVVVFAIVGIVMAFVGPSAGAWIQNTQLRNAAESVALGLQQARLEAIKRNKLIQFRLTDANSTEWQICVYDFNTDLCSTAADSVIATKNAAEGGGNARVGAEVNPTPNPATAIAAGTGVPGGVVFDSFGRIAPTAPSNITRVDIRNPKLAAADERRLVILVSVAGQVRMCDPKLVLSANPQGCQ